MMFVLSVGMVVNDVIVVEMTEIIAWDTDGRLSWLGLYPGRKEGPTPLCPIGELFVLLGIKYSNRKKSKVRGKSIRFGDHR